MVNKGYFAQCEPVELEQMLAARERRAQTQRQLLERYGAPIICLTLNIPGAYKLYPLARRAFDEGCRVVFARLGKLPAVHKSQNIDLTGCEGYFCVDAAPQQLKTLMMSIEDHHPLGRLFDIDVIDQSGPVKGASLGRPQRECLICAGPVWQCTRSRTHPPEQLAMRTAKLIDEFFVGKLADDVCKTAVRALLYEVSITPKPGLVDRANTGAHRDMDFFTFLDSGCALIAYFREITLKAIRFEGQAGELLPSLRFLGLCAEDEMLAATGGVNTHKGLVFSLGIVCAAVGYLYGKGCEVLPGSLFETCAKIAAGALSELESKGEQVTYGQAAYAGSGLTGARGQAAAGFPAVRDVGYPALERYISRGCSLETAGATALLHLMANVDDTNIHGRAGEERLRRVKARVKLLLQDTQDPQRLLDAAQELDRDFAEQNLSPGGSADLLAVSLMVYWILQPGFFGD